MFELAVTCQSIGVRARRTKSLRVESRHGPDLFDGLCVREHAGTEVEHFEAGVSPLLETCNAPPM